MIIDYRVHYLDMSDNERKAFDAKLKYFWIFKWDAPMCESIMKGPYDSINDCIEAARNEYKPDEEDDDVAEDEDTDEENRTIFVYQCYPYKPSLPFIDFTSRIEDVLIEDEEKDCGDGYERRFATDWETFLSKVQDSDFEEIMNNAMECALDEWFKKSGCFDGMYAILAYDSEHIIPLPEKPKSHIINQFDAQRRGLTMRYFSIVGPKDLQFLLSMEDISRFVDELMAATDGYKFRRDNYLFEKSERYLFEALLMLMRIDPEYHQTPPTIGLLTLLEQMIVKHSHDETEHDIDHVMDKLKNSASGQLHPIVAKYRKHKHSAGRWNEGEVASSCHERVLAIIPDTSKGLLPDIIYSDYAGIDIPKPQKQTKKPAAKGTEDICGKVHDNLDDVIEIEIEIDDFL